MKTKMLVLTLAFIGFCIPVNASVLQMHSEMLYNSVRVVGERGAMGSGTVIFSAQYRGEQHSYVLTNHHVVARNIVIKEEWSNKEQKTVKFESLSPVTVEWFDYNDLSREVGTRGKVADIVAYSKTHDLAVLRVRDKETKVKYVANLAPRDRTLFLFEESWVTGSGLGQVPFPTYGLISNLDQRIKGLRYILSSAPIIFGNSGGTLYHYEESCDCYEMIGVPSMMSGSWNTGPITHMGWSIPMGRIYDFLIDNSLQFIWGEEVPDEDEEE